MPSVRSVCAVPGCDNLQERRDKGGSVYFRHFCHTHGRRLSAEQKESFVAGYGVQDRPTAKVTVRVERNIYRYDAADGSSAFRVVWRENGATRWEQLPAGSSLEDARRVLAEREPRRSPCRACGGVIPGSRSTAATFCGDDCAREFARVAQRDRHRERIGCPDGLAEVVCETCGEAAMVPLLSARARRYCSDACRPGVSYRRFVGSCCERCGLVPESMAQLEVDHIDEDRTNHDPSNLRTLCANCHRLRHHSEEAFVNLERFVMTEIAA